MEQREYQEVSYKLFLDDIRTADMVYAAGVADEFIVVRSFDDFKAYITENGLPEFISFDNDLGMDVNGNIAPDGYEATKWLVYRSGFDLINLRFKVHSANPVASVQIKSLLDNYIKHLNAKHKL